MDRRPWNKGPRTVLFAFQRTRGPQLAPGLCWFIDYFAYVYLCSDV